MSPFECAGLGMRLICISFVDTPFLLPWHHYAYQTQFCHNGRTTQLKQHKDSVPLAGPSLIPSPVLVWNFSFVHVGTRLSRTWKLEIYIKFILHKYKSDIGIILARVSLPPNFSPCLFLNFSCRYFPNRLELSFMRVMAFPKASRSGFT